MCVSYVMPAIRQCSLGVFVREAKARVVRGGGCLRGDVKGGAGAGGVGGTGGGEGGEGKLVLVVGNEGAGMNMDVGLVSWVSWVSGFVVDDADILFPFYFSLLLLFH